MKLALSQIKSNHIMQTALLFILINIVVLMLLFIIPRNSEKLSLSANNGYLDLSHVNLDENKVVILTGDWSFYPNTFLNYGDFNQMPNNVPVPGNWNNFDLIEPSMNYDGYGTYRLRVKLPDVSKIYGIKYTRIRSAGKLFINDKLKAQSGTPATDRILHQPFIKPMSAYFHSNEQEVEIIIHASNFGYNYGGGISHQVYFGYQEGISDFESKTSIHEWMFLTAYLISFIYFVGSFIVVRMINKKSNYALLAFAGYIISISTFKITHGERLFLDFFQNVNYDFFYRLQFLPIGFAAICLTLYAYLLFKTPVTRRIKNVILVFAFAEIIKTLIVSNTTQSNSLWFELLVMLLTCLFLCILFSHSVITKKTGSLLLLIGSTAIMFDTYMEFGIAFGMQSINYNFPIQPFIFLLSQILLNSSYFSHQIDESEKLTKKIKQMDQFKNEFLAKTTHEFKTPLNGIVNILHTFTKDKTLLDKTQQGDIQLVQSIALRLSNLVNDILDITKIENDELHLQKQDVNLRSVAQDVIYVCEITYPDKAIEIINNLSSELPYVFADEQRVKQILYNLIGNALKFTKKGNITVEAIIKDDFMEVAINDTGRGISKKNLDNIFNTYYQEPDEIAQTTNSYGLGLNITQKLVELQGGHISVNSTVNVGTTFKFTLPLSNSKSIIKNDLSALAFDKPLPLETPIITNPKGTHTLLVVDDEYIGLKAISNALSDEDYKIISVKSGHEAIRYIQEGHKINVVILDLMMPDLSGFEVCRIIRKTYSLTELPILMVTAAIQPNDIIASYEAGANDFINKPFNQLQLITRVRSLIAVVEAAQYAIEVESALLLSQIKPHFLYNVLTTIAVISDNNQEAGREMLLKFASYLRMSFSLTKIDQLISIEQELEYIETFVDIQNIRFDNNIDYQLDFHITKPYNILPLIIQPLVENAIKHGNLIGDNRLKVVLNITQTNNNLYISVRDNGPGMSEDQIQQILTSKSVGLGLYNVQRRIARYYNSILNIDSVLNEGTYVSFTITDIDSLSD